MKALPFFLTLLLVAQVCSSQTWQRLDSDLSTICWADENTVFVAGTNSCILRSTDKGISWKQLSLLDTAIQINGISFSSKTTGCAVGGGKIYHTNDSGEHWLETTNPSGTYISSIVINSDGKGTALSNFGTILRSNDSGATWNITGKLGTGKAYTRLLFISPSIAIAMNQDSVVLSKDGGVSFTSTILTMTNDSGYIFFDMSVTRSGSIVVLGRFRKSSNISALLISNDTGHTWQTIPAPDFTFGISFPEISQGFSISSSHGIQFTHDQGATYSQQHPAESRFGEFLNSIRFSTSACGIAVGYKKKIYRTENGGKNWDTVSYLGTQGNNPLFPIQFVSPAIGFVGAYPTTIFRTTNGGATWLPQRKTIYQDGPNFSDNSTITSLYFHNALKGCGFTDGFDKHFFTDDGGEIVTAQRGVVAEGPKICFLDTLIGAVFSGMEEFTSQQPLKLKRQSYIGRTKDGGKTWENTFIDSIATFSGFYYSPTLLLTAGGILDSMSTSGQGYRRGIILRSTDGGQQWSREIFDKVDVIGDMTAIDDKTYILTGYKSRADSYFYPIYRTVDSGKTWNLVDSISDGGFRGMAFSNKRIGYIIGNYGSYLWTKDGGITWKHEQRDTLSTFKSIAAVSDGAFITAGSSIWKLTLPDSVTNSISEPTIEVSPAPSVWLRYPRPIPTTGKIILDAIWVMNLNVSSIRIKLYDMLGIELQDITDSFHANSGTNTGLVEFDGSNLPSGIYYIEINGGGFRKAVPVIIAR